MWKHYFEVTINALSRFIFHWSSQVNALPNPDRIFLTKRTRYEIRVHGALDQKWASYFSPFEIIRGEEETIMIGTVRDQAELFGILLKVRDMGITLLSISII
jgi:hypothetical protein